MGRFGRAGRIAALGALPLLAACASLGGPSPGANAVNLAGIDLSSAVFAVDLPTSVEPTDPPRITYGATLDMTLVRADAEQVMGILPPPAEGRSYAVYAFAPGDQAAIRGTQATALAGRSDALAVVPRLCATPDARRDSDTVAVLAVVPGRRPVTLTGPETIVSLEARTGVTLPVCAGHSG